MKKSALILTLICFSIFLISASCIKSKKKFHSQVNTESANKNKSFNPSNVYPKNWPWRGVCLESKKTKPSDIAYLASVNVNFVRILIKGNKRAMREKISPTKAFLAEISWADSILTEVKKYNMTSLIAFNNVVIDPNDEVNDKSKEFWENPSYQDSAISRLDVIVNHFKQRGDELSAYEVIGEPSEDGILGSSVPDNLEGFFKRVLSTIRKYDQQRYFLLTPGPWGRPTNYMDFNGFNINDDKLIYGAHMYLPAPFALQGVRKNPKGLKYPGKINDAFWDKTLIEKRFNALKEFQKRTNSLVYIGEFQSVRWAEGGDVWVKDVIDVIEKNGWAWSQYGYQSDTDFWDPYFDISNPNDPPSKWMVAYKGKDTAQWQLMLQYYARNKK